MARTYNTRRRKRPAFAVQSPSSPSSLSSNPADSDSEYIDNPVFETQSPSKSKNTLPQSRRFTQNTQQKVKHMDPKTSLRNGKHQMLTPSPTPSPEENFFPRDLHSKSEDIHIPRGPPSTTGRTNLQSPSCGGILQPNDLPDTPPSLFTQDSSSFPASTPLYPIMPTPKHPPTLPPTSFIPTRTVFPPHTISFERPNTWWTRSFTVLFESIQDFSRTYFGSDNLSEGTFHQPWDLGFPPEFIAWTDLVAECDPEDGAWEALLRDSRQRTQLVAAVIGRVLFHECIWGKELWGAEEGELDLLRRSEVVFMGGEGFDRTNLRSQLVRTILSSRPITTNFHPEVAILTTQIALLFQPLIDLLYSLPASETLPSILDYHQHLHDIVSHAAYLSICARASNSIFIYDHKMPGNRYEEDLDDMWCVENGCREASRLKKQGVWEGKRNVHLREMKAAEIELQELEGEQKLKRKEKKSPQFGKEKLQEQINSAKKELAELTKQSKSLASMERMYTEKVKIAVWPMIDRYLPGSGKERGEENGMRIWRVMDGAVVPYWMGRRKMKEIAGFHIEDTSGKVGLEEWLRGQKGLRRKGSWRGWRRVAWGVLVLVLLWWALRVAVLNSRPGAQKWEWGWNWDPDMRIEVVPV